MNILFAHAKSNANTLQVGCMAGSEPTRFAPISQLMVTEFKTLAKGITVRLFDGRTIVIRGFLKSVISDTPANAMMASKKGANAHTSCPGCLTHPDRNPLYPMLADFKMTIESLKVILIFSP